MTALIILAALVLALLAGAVLDGARDGEAPVKDAPVGWDITIPLIVPAALGERVSARGRGGMRRADAPGGLPIPGTAQPEAYGANSQCS